MKALKGGIRSHRSLVLLVSRLGWSQYHARGGKTTSLSVVFPKRLRLGCEVTPGTVAGVRDSCGGSPSN